jgi:hypothetical protein
MKKIICVLGINILLIGVIVAPSCYSINISTSLESTYLKEVETVDGTIPSKTIEKIKPANFELFEFSQAFVEGTFIPTPYFATPFVLKLPLSFRFYRFLNNICLEHFKGTITPCNENPLEFDRYNDSKIKNVYLSGDFSILKITKSDKKGIYNVKGMIYDIKGQILENESIPGEIIVAFRNYVTMIQAIAIGKLYGIKAIDFLRIFPYCYSVLYEVPTGEEFYWMAEFNTHRNVIWTELNTKAYAT